MLGIRSFFAKNASRVLLTTNVIAQAAIQVTLKKKFQTPTTAANPQESNLPPFPAAPKPVMK